MLKLLFELLHNLIDCPKLLEQINFKITWINKDYYKLYY